MLKIFLVEDEFIVREGIKNIDWAANGYEFVGEAADGELAFPLIQKLMPDIVITDIRMPFMDGLELSKLVKQVLPATEIIVLTGHEEFEYAKEAIKIGIAEYLLKPISSEKLLVTIGEIAARIEEKRKDEEILQTYRKEMEEDTKRERSRLFADIISSEKSTLALFEDSRALGMDLLAVCYCVILVQVRATKHEQGEYSRRIIAIEEELHGMEDPEKLLVFDRNLEGDAILLKADSEETLAVQVESCVARMCDIFAEYAHVRYFIAVGESVRRFGEISVSFEQACHAFAHRFLSKESKVLYYRNLERDTQVQVVEPTMRQMKVSHYERGRINDFIRTGELGEIRFFVEEFAKELGRAVLESKMFRQYLAMDVYFAVTSFLEELGQDTEHVPEADLTSETLSSAEAVLHYLEELVRIALESREESASNRYGDVVSEVTSYIENHYSNEELSLNELASHVNFSPNHLSMIFSQQTGQTFVKYLTEYRMNKAKELLRCTGKRSSVIAQEVGYKDSHYFSYLFKKTQGMTPTQYRGGGVS